MHMELGELDFEQAWFGRADADFCLLANGCNGCR